MGKSPSNAILALADKSTLGLFYVIAENKSIGSTKLKEFSTLSKKAYYSRTEDMIEAGLVKRKDGIFTLTVFGQIFYHACLQIDHAITKYSKSKERSKRKELLVNV